MKTKNLFHIGVVALALCWAQAGFALPIVDADEWSGTYLKGKKIGYNNARVKVKDSHIDVHTEMVLNLKTGDIDQSTRFTQETTLDKDLKLKGFVLTQELMGKKQVVVGVVAGDKLTLEITGRGFKGKETLDFPEGTVPSATVWLNIMKGGFTVGKKGQFNLLVEPMKILMPMKYQILRKETLERGGKQVEAFVVEQKFAGMTTTVWASAEGDMLREVSLQGFESIKESQAVATTMGGETMSVSSFIDMSLVEIKKPISRPDDKDRMKLKLSNVHSPQSIPQDHRQKVLKTEKKGEESYVTTLLIQREPKLPVKNVSRPITAKEFQEYLKETPEIQVKHALIRTLAKDMVGDEPDAWKAAKRISTWVFDNLEKELVDSLTALDALHDRRGECQSHTNLFTALTRAAGIPTRVVNGLVYSIQFKGFLYHAWPEVWVGEWRALDPTLGQHHVDATHIKLSEGNNAGALKLMEFIGQVEIELIEQ